MVNFSSTAVDNARHNLSPLEKGGNIDRDFAISGTVQFSGNFHLLNVRSDKELGFCQRIFINISLVFKLNSVYLSEI